MKNLKLLCHESCNIIEETARFIYDNLGKVHHNTVLEKSKNNFVSYVDQMAEKQLVEKLNLLLPESVFLTEEKTVDTKTGEYRWIIDPIDGTTNFLHGLPYFAISVALQHCEDIVLGIVYEVSRQECFYAWQNGGAYLNGEAIQVSQTPNLNNSLIVTGFPDGDYRKVKKYLRAYEYFLCNTRSIRRYGAAAVDLAFIACGRFDGYFQHGLNAWDIAAGALIVKEAGGMVTDFRGGTNFIFGGEIIASNPVLHSNFMPIVESLFYDKTSVL